ncbi:MAG: hypothetical protein MKZ95_18390, partial [Pirellulales bacterium]|nr:hypothetical protein [Pirellulales bacterium]
MSSEHLMRWQLASGNTGQRTSVVGCSNNHRIQLFVVDHLAVVGIRTPLLLLFLRRLFQSRGVAISDGNDSSLPGKLPVRMCPG